MTLTSSCEEEEKKGRAFFLEKNTLLRLNNYHVKCNDHEMTMEPQGRHIKNPGRKNGGAGRIFWGVRTQSFMI